ncbi:MAG: hypothetical protein PSX36_00935 [bacterium]|nr:hypothetical protein [bacterium]
MIPFLIYSLVFLLLIYYNGFFGLFKDEQINPAQYTLLLLGKILAVPVFYVTYKQLYGGIQNFDTGKFYNDVQVITHFAKTDPGFYFRLIFGLQDDAPGSYDFENCLKYTLNWDNGTVKDYLYNDNRVVIRIHTLLDFLTFGSYLTHSLFNCFLSFVGIHFLYKSFKDQFSGKEIGVLLILCFFPALWFYTGALLKEGLCLFVMGCSAFQIKQLSERRYGWKRFLFMVALLYLSFLLKPYLLLFFILCFGLYFFIQRSTVVTRKIGMYLAIIAGFVIIANTLSLALKKRSFVTAVLEHQRRFEAVSKGGVFLTDSLNYMQLKPDTTLIKRTSKKNWVTIRPGVPYMYWEPNRPLDTLYCLSNEDTLSSYQLIYFIPQSGSNILLNKTNALTLILSSWYYSLMHPFFLHTKNSLQKLASLENFLVLISLLITFWGLLGGKKDNFLPVVFLFFSLTLSLVIGLSAPNSGAIFRYRAPALIFVVMAALYFLDLSNFRRRGIDP